MSKTAATIVIITLLVLASKHAPAQTAQSYVRDQTSSLWHGKNWHNNPIKNEKLLFQNAIVPLTADKAGWIENPDPQKPTLCRILVYLKKGAPDQTLMELKPTKNTEPAAAIKLEGQNLILELKGQTENGWLNQDIQLKTPVEREKWVSKEILFIPTSQEQTIGWAQLVNRPVNTANITKETKMIRQQEDKQWIWETIQLKNNEGWELGEITWDRDIKHSRTEDANIFIQ